MTRRWLAIAWVLVGCGGEIASSDGARRSPPPIETSAPVVAAAPSSNTPAPSPAATISTIPQDPAAPKTKIAGVAMTPQSFKRARLDFEGLADVPVELTSWDVGGVFFQGVRPRPEEEVRLLVRAHGDEDLAGFERDHQNYTVIERRTARVCGQAADLLRVKRGEQRIACVKVAGGDNHPAIIPPQEILAVSFRHADLGVVLTVEVAAAKPEAYAEVAKRVLDSIRCL